MYEFVRTQDIVGFVDLCGGCLRKAQGVLAAGRLAGRASGLRRTPCRPGSAVCRRGQTRAIGR